MNALKERNDEELRARIGALVETGRPLGLRIEHKPGRGWVVTTDAGRFSSVAANLAGACQVFRHALLMAFAGTNPDMEKVPGETRRAVLSGLAALETTAAGDRLPHHSL